MKTRIILLASILLLSDQTSAQSLEGRLIDMKFSIESPEDGHYFKLPAIVDIKIRATNLGPDTLCEGDTLYYGFNISSHARRLLIYKLKGPLLPGASAVIEDTIAFKDRPSPPWAYNYGSTLFEIYGCYAVNRSGGKCKNINADYDNRNGRNLNNRDTTTINYTNAQSSTRSLASETSMFPQPFSKGFNIRHYSGIRQVEIMDVMGRTLFTENFSGMKDLQISPENISDGLYYLKITDIQGQSETLTILKRHE